jgi:hypothetical protein
LRTSEELLNLKDLTLIHLVIEVLGTFIGCPHLLLLLLTSDPERLLGGSLVRYQCMGLTLVRIHSSKGLLVLHGHIGERSGGEVIIGEVEGIIMQALSWE